MAVGMWNSMIKIGITNISEDFDPIARIQELVKRDSKVEKVGKGIETSFQC